MDFISRNFATFGLLGANNVLPAGPEQTPAPFDGGFSHGGHLRLGYNNQAFNWRKSASDIFWCGYGKSSREPLSLREESIRTMRLIHQEFGVFSLPNTGSVFSRFMIERALEAEIEFDTITVAIQGTNAPPDVPPHRGHDKKTEISLAEFESWIDAFSLQFESKLVRPAFVSLLAEQSDRPHVFDDCAVRLLNLNVSFMDGAVIGPPNWIIFDSEIGAASWRYLIASRKRGVPAFFKYTPDLLQSYLADPYWESWLQRNPNVRSNAIGETHFLKRQGTGALKESPEQLAAISKWIDEKQFSLSGAHKGFDSSWMTPLSYFFEEAAIEPDSD